MYKKLLIIGVQHGAFEHTRMQAIKGTKRHTQICISYLVLTNEFDTKFNQHFDLHVCVIDLRIRRYSQDDKTLYNLNSKLSETFKEFENAATQQKQVYPNLTRPDSSIICLS